MALTAARYALRAAVGDAGGGGFSLPYSGSVAYYPAAFEVTNTGMGYGVQGKSGSLSYGVGGTNTVSGNYAGLGGENVAL